MSFKPKSASIVYYVSDIARTETFYNETLALDLQRMEGAALLFLCILMAISLVVRLSIFV